MGFLFISMKKKHNIPYHLIEYCNNNGLLNELYWFYRLRNIYSNNTFYDFNYRKVSKILDCSVSTTHKFIAKLIEQGWAILTKEGHFKLLGINKLWLKYAPEKMITKNSKSFIVQVPKSNIKSDQLTFFRGVLLHNNIARQLKEVVSKTKIVNNCKNNLRITKKELKKIQKSGGEKEVLSERFLNKRLTLSNRTIGIKVFRSVSSVKRYTKNMVKLGIFKIKAHYKFVERGLSQNLFILKYGLRHNFQYSVKEQSVYTQCSNTYKLPKSMYIELLRKYNLYKK
jgi:hypothetical protein